MKLLNPFFSFYINASIHVALAVYALMRITEIYFELTTHKTLNNAVFFGSIVAYNFVKYAGVAKLHHRSLTTSLRFIQLFSGCCFLIALYYFVQLNMQTILVFIPFGIVTFFYAAPLLFRKENLRNIGGLKTLIIALVWAGVTVVIPIFSAQNNIDSTTLLVFVQRFLLVIVLMIPFDIRDVNYDHLALKTLPQRFGLKKVKRIALLLLMLVLFIEMQLGFSKQFIQPFFLICLLLLVLVFLAQKQQSKYYSAFWVESIPIFWWLLLLISK